MFNLPFRLHGAISACAALAAAHASLLTPAAAQTVSDDPTRLDEIAVTGNRVEGPTAAIGSAISSISGEELEKRQIRVVSDVLREMPGVAVNRTGPVGALTQIRIRGSEGNQTLVIVDGSRMNDPASSAEFDFANLLNLEVERIDVLRGPQSALYGSDAAGGVINIVTRKGEPGPTRFRASLEGGSFNTVTGTASVSGGTEAYDYLVAGQGFRTRGISIAKTGAPGSGLDRDAYENATVLVKFSARPSEMFEVTGVARVSAFDAERDEFGTIPGRPFSESIDSGQREKGQQVFGRLQGKATLLDGAWDHVVGLNYTNQDRRRYEDDGSRSSSSLGEFTKLDYQTNYRFSSEGAVPATHVLTFGADTQRDAVVAKSVFQDQFGNGPVREHIDNSGVVGQYQIGLFDDLFVTASVRQDINENFKDETTYRLASAYTVDATRTKLRASYGTGVKNPTATELFGFFGDFVGNPDLTPEKTEGWDFGFDQPLLDDRIVLDATYFEQQVRDLISSRFVPELGKSQPINLPGTSKIDGVELGLTVRPLPELSFRAAYTYADGKDPNGDELVRRPRHLASFNANYAFHDGKGNLNTGVVYNGKQKDFRFFNVAPFRDVVALKSYALANVAASYKVHPNAEVYGRIENLFDKDYEEVFTYNTPGRAAYAGVKVSF